MKISKAQREELKNKYGGRCSYCGDLLSDNWCVDHIEPIVRNWTDGTCEFPERDVIENLTPACRSCNIIKSSQSIEGFRRTVRGFIKSLNRDSTQYKFAKRYGLVEETSDSVKFYFEEYE